MTEFLNNVKQYIKIHLATVILAFFALIVITTWLFPSENKTNSKIDAIYNQIALNYDTANGSYTNMAHISRLQADVNNLKNASEFVKMIKVALYSLLLTIIIALLGSFMQFAYTKIKFTDSSPGNVYVLASVILSTTIIVMITFYSFFK